MCHLTWLVNSLSQDQLTVSDTTVLRGGDAVVGVGTACIYDVTTLHCEHRLDGHQGEISKVTPYHHMIITWSVVPIRSPLTLKDLVF